MPFAGLAPSLTLFAALAVIGNPPNARTPASKSARILFLFLICSPFLFKTCPQMLWYSSFSYNHYNFFCMTVLSI